MRPDYYRSADARCSISLWRQLLKRVSKDPCGILLSARQTAAKTFSRKSNEPYWSVFGIIYMRSSARLGRSRSCAKSAHDSARLLLLPEAMLNLVFTGHMWDNLANMTPQVIRKVQPTFKVAAQLNPRGSSMNTVPPALKTPPTSRRQVQLDAHSHNALCEQPVFHKSTTEAESRVFTEQKASPVTFDRLLDLLEKAPKLTGQFRQAQMMTLYAGSFWMAQNLVASALTRLMSESASLKKLNFTESVCVKMRDLLIKEAASCISEEGARCLDDITGKDLIKLMCSSSGNIKEGAIEIISALKKSHGYGAASSDDDLDADRVGTAFDIGSKRKQEKQSVGQRLEEVGESLASVDRQFVAPESLRELMKAPVLLQLSRTERLYKALAHVVTALDRAMVKLALRAATPNIELDGISTNVIHFWLAAVRWEQINWSARFGLNLRQIERAATANIGSRDVYYGARRYLVPPRSYLTFDMKPETWREPQSQKTIEKDAPYFHLLKDEQPSYSDPDRMTPPAA